MRLRSPLTTFVAALALGIALVIATALTPKAQAPAPPPKVSGRVYVIPGGDFLVSLRDGRLALLGVTLVLPPDEELGIEGDAEGDSPVQLPRGPAARRRDARIRAAITAILGDQTLRAFKEPPARAAVRRRIRLELDRRFGVSVSRVIFSDLALR